MSTFKLISSRIMSAVTGVAAVMFLVFGYALDIKADTQSGWKKEALEWCQDNAPNILFYLAAIQVIAWLVGRFLQPRSNSQRIIDENVDLALENFRKAVFLDIPDNVADDENRVSLFRYEKWNWQISLRRLFQPNGQRRELPWAGWLVLLRRSGHLTQHRKAAFLVPDEVQHLEGVAGKGFRCSAAGAGRRVDGEENTDFRLPDLSSVEYIPVPVQARHAGGVSVTREQAVNIDIVERYAEATDCTASFIWGRIKRNLKNPRSILAMRLVSSHNKRPWGVVVVDSFNEHDCLNTDVRRFRTAFKQLIGRLDELEITK